MSVTTLPVRPGVGGRHGRLRRPATRRRAAVAAAIILAVSAVWFVADRASAPVPSAQAYLTTSDGAQQVAAQPAVDLASDTTPAASTGSQTLHIDTSSTFQTLEGVGASLTDSSAYLISHDLNGSQRSALMSRLFDPKSGLGLSYLRQPLGASDFSRGSYTYDDVAQGDSDPDLKRLSISKDEQYVIPLVRQARKLDPTLKVMLSPWSAPAWMRTDDSLTGKGTLKADDVGVYARYLVASVQAYEKAGVPVAALTLQNEPLTSGVGYPAMHLTAGQEATLAVAVRAELKRAGLATELIGGDLSWDQASYALQLLSNPSAAAALNGVAFHCYSGVPGAQAELATYLPSTNVYLTECSAGAWATGIAKGLQWSAENLLIGATRAGAKSVIDWNIALDTAHGPTNGGCNDCRGLVTIDPKTGNVTENPELWALGQLAKVARPGAVRVATHSPDAAGLENVAFVNPDGSRALVAFNPQAHTVVATVDDGQHSFPITVPGGGLMSIRWPGAALKTAVSQGLSAVSGVAQGSGGYPVGTSRRIRIMPLGDSLADGFVVPGGWRTQLWNQLVQTNHDPVTFVGSERSGPTELGDQSQEGHPGYRIDELDAHAATWLKASRPDIILLGGGTNDLLQGASAAQTLSRMKRLLSDIYTVSPHAQVLISSLIPLKSGHEKEFGEYNAGLPGVLADRRAAGQQVQLVDMTGAVTKAHYSDAIHPDQQGYNAMANRWARAVQPLIARLRSDTAADDGLHITATTNALGVCCLGDSPEQAADGRLDTRWSTGYPQEPGQALQIDLGESRTIHSLTMDTGSFAGDEPAAFDVSVSSDGTTWERVATGRGTGERTGVSWPPTSIRYMRIELTGTSEHWWSVAELSVA